MECIFSTKHSVFIIKGGTLIYLWAIFSRFLPIRKHILIPKQNKKCYRIVWKTVFFCLTFNFDRHVLKSSCFETQMEIVHLVILGMNHEETAETVNPALCKRMDMTFPLCGDIQDWWVLFSLCSEWEEGLCFKASTGFGWFCVDRLPAYLFK